MFLESKSSILSAIITVVGLTCAGCNPIQQKTPSADIPQDLTKGPAPSEPSVPNGMVELTLKDDLDGDLNGYCIDIVGGGPNINPDNGLQAHTCYSYRGALGSDQAIDPKLFRTGIIKIAAFNVCAIAETTNADNRIALKACDSSRAQQFIISESGTIAPTKAPDMCLTAGEDTRFGRGGTSPHQIKSLTLQPCSVDLAKRQEWRTRNRDD